MRLFLALDVNKPARAALTALEQKMPALGVSGGNYVPPGNFHITLRFLGETDRLGEAALAMREGVRGIRPFVLTLGRYGTFGSNQGRTAIVHLEGNLDELRVLHESMEAALADAGFGREKRALKPHVTLARKTAPHDALFPALNDALTPVPMTIDHVTLYESVRTRDGRLIYQPLRVEKF